MLDVSNTYVLAIAAAVVVSASLLLLVAVYMAFSLRIASRERERLSRELFGLVRKIEGLTASRRELISRHYDRMLENLSVRLPSTIAAQTGQVIFETESKILQRLAELEPDLKNDANSKKKMNELVRSMENLQEIIIALTSDTVRRVMTESRHGIIDEANEIDLSEAA